MILQHFLITCRGCLFPRVDRGEAGGGVGRVAADILMNVECIHLPLTSWSFKIAIPRRQQVSVPVLAHVSRTHVSRTPAVSIRHYPRVYGRATPQQNMKASLFREQGDHYRKRPCFHIKITSHKSFLLQRFQFGVTLTRDHVHAHVCITVAPRYPKQKE